MQQGKDIIGRIFAVNIALLEEAAGAQHPLFKVHLLPGLDVVKVDGDEVVSVRPRVLVDES